MLQVAHAVLKHGPALLHLLDPDLECLIHRVEICTVLDLTSVRVDDHVVDSFGTFDGGCTRTRCNDRLVVLDDPSSTRRALSIVLSLVFLAC